MAAQATVLLIMDGSVTSVTLMSASRLNLDAVFNAHLPVLNLQTQASHPLRFQLKESFNI